MRLQKREVKEPGELKKILEACKVVRIGAMDAEGMFVVPVNFGYEFQEEERRLRLYIHGAKEGRKARAFAVNPKVAVEMDCEEGIIRGDYVCSYSYGYASIMGSGRIRELTDIKEKIYGLTLLMEHMAPEAELKFSKEMTEAVGVYCIDVEEFTGKCRKSK